MRVGVVNMYPSENGGNSIIKALDKLGHSSFLLKGDEFSEEDLFARIKKSPIKNWIFSGSTLHIHEGGPQVPLDILKLEKRFLLICYSMESLVTRICKCEHHLKERYIHKNENFHLKQPSDYWLFDGIKEEMVLRRNHHWYLPAGVLPVYEIASYRGELMIAGYKNCLMMQFHPEKTADGAKMIANWLVTCEFKKIE
jgi:GMP synthase-like glutamine amidotransferase